VSSPSAAPAHSASPDLEPSRLHAAAPMLLLALLSIPLLFFGLGSYSLVNGDEAIYHSVAEGMANSGDWQRIDFKGQHRIYDTFMNAPLQYWVRAALVSAFGSSYWTMRILSALFGLASVLVTYRLVLRLADRQAAFLAGLLQLTTFQFVYLHSARTGELEPVLAFLFTLTLLLFLRIVEDGRGYVAHHLCLVLLLNLKLPVAIIPVAAELLCFALLARARPRFWRWAWSGLCIVPLGLLWHVTQMIRLWDSFLLVLNSMGGQASGSAAEGSPLGNLVFYARTYLFGAFPYALVYPFALAGVLFSKREPKDRARWATVALFLAAHVVFYLLVAKHYPWYLIPTYPLLCAFLAVWLRELWIRDAGPLAIAAGSVAGAGMLWIAIATSYYNPFAKSAYVIPMRVGWRGGLGVEAWAAALATALLLASVLLLLRKLLEGRFRGALALALCASLVGFAAVRVALPLRFVAHQSKLARFQADLSARLAAGEELPYPIDVPERSLRVILFYFADDFDIDYVGGDPKVNPPGQPKVDYQLFEKGSRERLHPRMRRDAVS
jgi:4-amino-4-deoxy-L-arabinose transferase-like glycosyltransferase